MEAQGILMFSLVALLWGGTNPLIEKSVTYTKDYEPDDYSPSSVISVAKSKLFIVAFAVNQLGSVLYASLLSSYGEQYSNIIANSLTAVVTFLAESLWKGKKITTKKICGMTLILCGVIIILI